MKIQCMEAHHQYFKFDVFITCITEWYFIVIK